MLSFNAFSLCLTLYFYCASFVSADSGDLNCLEFECNFEQESLCSYENFQPDGDGSSSSEGPTKQWKVSKGYQKNLATGVRNAAEGNFYASTYLLKNDSAVLMSQGHFKDNTIRFVFPLSTDRVIRFRVYKVAESIVLRGCCDSISNCPYETEKTSKITDFGRWKTASFLCKAGTEKILFYGLNLGRNEGGIGIDDIQLLIPSGDDPTQAKQSACDTWRQENTQPSEDVLVSNSTSETSNSTREVLASLLASIKKFRLAKSGSAGSNDSEALGTTTSTTPVDNVVVMIVPNDQNVTQMASTNVQLPTRKLPSKDDIVKKRVARDGVILSSRLTLVPNETKTWHTEHTQNTFGTSLEVQSQDVISLDVGPSSGQVQNRQPDDD